MKILIRTFSEKSNFYEVVHEKPVYRGELPKSGAWTVWKFKGKLGEKEGVFLTCG